MPAWTHYWSNNYYAADKMENGKLIQSLSIIRGLIFGTRAIWELFEFGLVKQFGRSIGSWNRWKRGRK